MSLQGTLESFPIPEVLKFLAMGNKTGRLTIAAGRGGGDVWMDEGSVVAVETAVVSDPTAAMFELLRETEGSFDFDDDVTRSDAGEPLDLDALLSEAQARLEEWREVEAVVPSVDCIVDLAGELADAAVRLDRDQWRLVVAVAHEATVAGVGDRLSLDEFSVSKAVKELVERGLVTVGAVEDAVPTRRKTAPKKSRPEIKAEATDDAKPASKKRTSRADAAEEAAATAADIDAMAEAIAEMGPEAQEAVEKAVRAETDEEREAALDGVADDDPVNRGLLLKFLSSVQN